MLTLSRPRFLVLIVGLLCAIGLVVAPVAAAAGNGRGAHHGRTARGADHGAAAQGHRNHGAAHGHAKSHGASESHGAAASHGHGASASHGASKSHGAPASDGAAGSPGASGGKGNHGAAAESSSVKAPAAPAAHGEEHAPAGNKGSMKVRPVGTPAAPPRNYAHLPCTVQVDFYGVPHDGATVTAASHAPTAPTGQTLLSDTLTFEASSPNPHGNELVGTTTLDFSSVVEGLTYHEQQGYHVKLTASIDGPQGANVKHKVFWIDCAPAAPITQPGQDVAPDQNVTPDTDTDKDGSPATDTDQPASPPITPVAVDAADESGVLGVYGERTVGAPAAVAPAAVAVMAVPATPSDLAATGIPAGVLALLALVVIAAGVMVLRRTRSD